MLWLPDLATHSTPPHHNRHSYTHPPTYPTRPLINPHPRLLQVEYTPIEYADQPLVNSFTQFLVRCGCWRKVGVAHWRGKIDGCGAAVFPAAAASEHAWMLQASRLWPQEGEARATCTFPFAVTAPCNAMLEAECYKHRPALPQCVCRVRNVQEQRPIELSNTHLQYWLNGPLDDMPPPSYTLPDPESVFVVQCEWATTGACCSRHARALHAGPGRIHLFILFTRAAQHWRDVTFLLAGSCVAVAVRGCHWPGVEATMQQQLYCDPPNPLLQAATAWSCQWSVAARISPAPTCWST